MRMGARTNCTFGGAATRAIWPSRITMRFWPYREVGPASTNRRYAAGLILKSFGLRIRFALRRALRIAKIYIDFGRQRKAAMIRLRALQGSDAGRGPKG